MTAQTWKEDDTLRAASTGFKVEKKRNTLQRKNKTKEEEIKGEGSDEPRSPFCRIFFSLLPLP